MIGISGTNKAYDTGNRALRNVNITTKDGEFVFIVGRNGPDKSTLLRLLLKEAELSSGKIIVSNMHLGKIPRHYMLEYRRKLGMMLQDSRLLRDGNVYENVASAPRIIDAPTKVVKEPVPTMPHIVRLSSRYKFFPQQLSGGEQQRVAITRTLINNSEVFLANEPAGNLDNHNVIEIMKLLEEINQRGATVIVVTHSQEIVDRMQKRVITVNRGVIVSDEKRGGYTYEDWYILVLPGAEHY